MTMKPKRPGKPTPARAMSPRYDAVIRVPFGVLGIRAADGVLTDIDFLPARTVPRRPRDAFTAGVVSPSGALRLFGTRGSSPGKFNIAGSIVADERGWIFVLDRLRSVVIVFDPKLKFVLEFGYRGDGPTNLIAPFDLAVGNGRIFVSQARDRGVKVFQYDFSKPAPPPPLGAKRG